MVKNPKKIVRYTSNGKLVIRNPEYDPTKCEKCGKKHGWFQKKCKQ